MTHVNSSIKSSSDDLPTSPPSQKISLPNLPISTRTTISSTMLHVRYPHAMVLHSPFVWLLILVLPIHSFPVLACPQFFPQSVVSPVPSQPATRKQSIQPLQIRFNLLAVNHSGVLSPIGLSEAHAWSCSV